MKHIWKIARLNKEPVSLGGTNMKEVAYLVCDICGQVKKQDILVTSGPIIR